MKKKVSALLSLILIFALTTVAYAKPTAPESVLSQSEIAYLTKQVGLTEAEFKYFDIETLRSLIAKQAKRISFQVEKDYSLSNATGADSTSESSVTPLSTIPSTDITLWGTAFLITSDITGKKKITLYGNFEWKKDTVWRLVDKMSIGYPTTNLWTYNTSGGTILGHQNRTCNLNQQTVQWDCTAIKTVPSDATNGAGVAATFDLSATTNYTKGYIQQDVYVNSTNTGTSNVLFRYGHRTLTGSVGVSVLPAGLSVTPATNTDTADYWVTFSW